MIHIDVDGLEHTTPQSPTVVSLPAEPLPAANTFEGTEELLDARFILQA